MHTKETHFYLTDILHKLILTNSQVSKYPNTYASVSISKDLCKSSNTSIGAVQSFFLSCSKSCCCVSVHLKTFFQFSFINWFKGHAMWLNPSMNHRRKFAKPRKILSSWMFWGVGQSLRICTFFGSTWFLAESITYPKYLMLVIANEHLSMSDTLDVFGECQSCFTCSSHDRLKIKISSR